jgi:uncharacterized protein (TIGR03492 family)
MSGRAQLMARLIWVSNGQAEDLIAARIWRALAPQLPGWSAAALPLVGRGDALAEVGLEVLGPRTVLPAGGLTLHHPRLLLADLRAGLLGSLREQLHLLRSERCDAVLVVGDVYAQAMAALLPGRPLRLVYQSLVSERMRSSAAGIRPLRAFMEGIRAPERRLMRASAAVFTRDAITAEALRLHHIDARFLGNPMMDGLDADPLGPRIPTLEWPAEATLALLPGSRSYAPRALAVMLAALGHLDVARSLRFLMPWQGPGEPELGAGWMAAGSAAGWTWLRRGRWSLGWARGRFAEALASSDAALGATGTAQEQAAGLGCPVVTFALPPDISPAFLENQQRLLGRALEVAPSEPSAIALALERALFDPQRRAAAHSDGPERMGGAGGSQRIAEAMAQCLSVRG